MGTAKGFLIVPVGFNPDFHVRAFTLSADDYLNCVLSAGLVGGGMGTAKGNLASLAGYNPDGNLRVVELDANDNLIISLLGGAAWEILRSDGTDAEWDTLADVIEAALMTVDGDILIRSGGAVTRLAAGAAGEILTMVGGVPAWGAAPGASGASARVRVTKTTTQTFTDGVYDKIEYDAEQYDLYTEYDPVTNFRFTASEDGYYHARMAMMSGSAAWTTDDVALIALYKNGVVYSVLDINRPELNVTTYKYLQGGATLQLDATDYLEMWTYIRRGADTTIFEGTGDTLYNWFEVNKVD